MKNILAVLGLISGVVAGLYVGGWLMFIMAIVGIVETIKGDIDGLVIAINALKIIFCFPVGIMTFAFVGKIFLWMSELFE